MGDNWCERNLKPVEAAPTNDFLRRGIASADESLRNVDRTIQLAEFLTRLKSVTNFQLKVEDLRNYGIEETFYELRVASELQERGFLTQFVKPSKVRGQDFDLKGSLDGETFAVEIKCLTDEPPYNAKRLLNRLRKAASQLPATGRGVIYIMLPPGWISTNGFLEESLRTVEFVFRKHTRVNGICFHWEDWSSGPPPYARLIRFVFTMSKSPKVVMPNLRKIFDATPRTPPPGARQFIEVSFI